MPEFRTRPFKPAWWLPGAHAQTLGGRWLRRSLKLPLQRERLSTPDGDFVDLDWCVGHFGDTSPLVLVLHGLEGSSRSGYVLETHRVLASAGMRSVGLNFRSCGGEPNLTARFYHAGETGDLGYIVEQLVARYPDAPLGAVGFSLGGNVLLKWVGEQGSGAALFGAVAVSVPYDLAAGARALKKGLGPFYSRHFIRSLRRKLLERGNALDAHCDLQRGIGARTLREFDDAVTAPLHGFRDVEHYYAVSSSAGFLRHIRVPTLLLHALDDPFLPTDALPLDAVNANPCLFGGFTEHGGHVGFVAGAPKAPEFWAEAEAARFLSAMLPSPQRTLATTYG